MMPKKKANKKKPNTSSSTQQAISEAFRLLSFIKECDAELIDSNLADDVKWLLSYMLQGIAGGGDPLLGLVDRSALRKARKLMEQEGIAYGFQIREAGGMPRKNIIEILSKYSGKKTQRNSAGSSLTRARSSVYKNVNTFRRERVVPMSKNQIEEEIQNLKKR